MTRKETAIALPLAILLALGLSSCAPGAGATTQGGGTGNSSQAAQNSDAPANEALDENGYAIPGKVLTLDIGDSVAYYSYPTLSKDDAQRVTISSFNYVEKADLPPGPHMNSMKNGVLVLSLIWANVKGNVQSNQNYIVATLDSGQVGRPVTFMAGLLKNGRVEPRESRTGIFTIDIPRGTTTLTIVDYRDAPVARMVIDTRR